MAKVKPVQQKDLVGVWQMAPIAGMVQTFMLRADTRNSRSNCSTARH